MTTVSTIQGNVTVTASRSPVSLLDRLVDWMNNVVDAFCGPAPGEVRHENPSMAYLFLNSSCCDASIDSKLWDLLNDRQPKAEIEEASNV